MDDLPVWIDKPKNIRAMKFAIMLAKMQPRGTLVNLGVLYRQILGLMGE